MITQPPEINEALLDTVGDRLMKLWQTYVTDRKPIEERWLRNLRQVRKVYDPEVLTMIPADRSKAYPGLTQWLVRGTIARLMQLLFPMTEKNYGVRPSPLPDLSTEQLQEVLDGLVAEKAQDGDPSQVQLTDAEIEKAILDYAKGKAERMEVKVDDDLQEMEYITLARKVVRSAVVYNVGVLKGPMHRKVKRRTWARNQFTGEYKAVEVDGYKPLFEFVPVWGYYPDMTAVDINHQDGEFERHIFTREEVEALGDRPDFLSERVNKWLTDNTTGNYKAQWFESVIKGEPKSGQASVASKESRKYEALSYRGTATGHELRAAGVEVPDADIGKSFRADIWMLDRTVIKLRMAPLGEDIRQYHVFVFEDDDLSILGNGQCDVLRDSQMGMAETVRAALDNMSVIGPAAEVNTDMLTPGQDLSIRKHKTWFRESQGGQSDGIPAVRDISIQSHLSELIPLIRMFQEFGEKESGLPPASLGDTSGGGSEAMRTTKNASMFLGAAALPVRDTVRNYDTFTISVISALVAWNRKYDPNPTRDGDHDVIARGSTSLIAKEVLAQSLEGFRAGLTPDELPHVKVRALLKARAKANDIPVDDLLEDEDKAEQLIAQNAEMQSQQMQSQADLVEAQIKELLTRAIEHEAKAQAEGATVGVSVFQTLIDAINSGHKATAEQAKTLVAAHAADTARMVAEKPAAGGGV